MEILRKLVEKGGRYREVDAMTIYKELNFIEHRHLEDYFLVAYQLVSELKREKNIIFGPGWGRMISSHVCYSLGISNISPVSVGGEPILIWGDKKKVPTIDIEVDEESYDRVFQKAIELFGFENVARMPVNVGPNQDLRNHFWIGTNANGEKVYLHACALLICLNGIEKNFEVDEMIDELCEKAVRYCNFMREQWGDFSDIYPDVAEDIDTNIPEDISGRDILRYIFKPVLFISEPDGEGIGYNVEAQCVWEPEHGIDMIFRDDRVLYAASPEGLGAWADDDEYETVFDE